MMIRLDFMFKIRFLEFHTTSRIQVFIIRVNDIGSKKKKKDEKQ